MAWLMILAGLAGLFLGGEMLVRGALGLAARLGLPAVLVGLTVVGFGTSMPELWSRWKPRCAARRRSRSAMWWARTSPISC